MTFSSEERTIADWVRGIFQLSDGRRITRTIRREVVIHPDDATGERLAIATTELQDELRHAGHGFPEGYGVLVEILGTAHG
jgi:hypothetical protein